MDKSNGKLPEFVNTELGEATVSVLHQRSAHKTYLCPLCDEDINVGEKHAIVVPVVSQNLRRHIHIDCIETFRERGLTIRLHPKEPHAAKYNL